MPSIVTDALFSEPSGRPVALAQFGGALLLLCVYAYGLIVGTTTANWVLVMVAGTALAGVAESLPRDRRRTAGSLRLAAILLLLGLVAAVLVAPEFVVG